MSTIRIIVVALLVALVAPVPASSDPPPTEDQILRIYEEIDALELKHQARFEGLEAQVEKLRARLARTRHRLYHHLRRRH